VGGLGPAWDRPPRQRIVVTHGLGHGGGHLGGVAPRREFGPALPVSSSPLIENVPSRKVDAPVSLATSGDNTLHGGLTPGRISTLAETEPVHYLAVILAGSGSGLRPGAGPALHQRTGSAEADGTTTSVGDLSSLVSPRRFAGRIEPFALKARVGAAALKSSRRVWGSPTRSAPPGQPGEPVV
jgi:hypothetical protein